MNDIFISYRREGGSTTARLICKMLESAGFRCFFDSESLSFGSFADSIKENLRSSRNFILILSPGALDRCQSQDDWVRQEIALALELHRTEQIKRIIPLFTNGVTGFPTDLPVDIRAITEQNAVELNHKDFDSNFARLLERTHHEKRDKLINQFLDLHVDSDDLENLLETFSECLSPEQQLHALKNSIKTHWEGNIELLLGGYSDSFLRVLCSKLGIHEEGGQDALLERIEEWVKHDKLDSPHRVVSKSILNSYMTHCSGSLSSLCDQLALKVDKRSPQAMREMLTGRLELELNFHSPSLPMLKNIANEALGEDVTHGLRRRELIEMLTATYERGRQEEES